MLVVSAPFPGAVYLGQVATRSFIPTDRSAANTKFMCRTMHKARQDISELQVAYAAWAPDANATGQELASGADLTIKAAVEYNGAIVGTLQWGGSATGTITAGQTKLSDLCALSQTIPSGATFYLRPYITSTAASVPYSTTGGAGTGIFAAGECCNQGTGAVADLTAATGAFGTTNSTDNIYPVAIIANTTKPSFLLIGDSRMVGSRGTPNASGDVGEAAISIGPSYAYIDCGNSGENAFSWSRYHSRRLELAQYASHVLVGFPVNDVRSGGKARTFAQVQSDMANLWELLGGKPIIQLTCSPWSTSTDGFATVANQTTDAGNPARVSWNQYVRGVPAPLAAVCDITTVTESSLDSGKWTPNYTSEGGHPNDTAYAALGASGVINAGTLAATRKVAQLWSPQVLFPKGVGTADVSWWIVANDETCTGSGNEILKGKSNEAAWAQATVGKRPVLTAAVINGRKAWRFTAASLQEVNGSNQSKKATNGQPGLLMCAVIKYNGAGAANQQLIHNSRNGSGTSNRCGLIIDTNSKVNTAVRRAEGDSSAVLVGSTVLQAGSSYIVLAQVDLTNNTVKMRVNGADEATTGTAVPVGSGNWPATDASGTAIGSVNGSLYFDGWIAEVIQIPGVQTDDDIRKLEGRLASQYGIALPGGHPYAAGPLMV